MYAHVWIKYTYKYAYEARSEQYEISGKFGGQ